MRQAARRVLDGRNADPRRNQIQIWPKPAEISELLTPTAEAMREDLRALETIAESTRQPTGPAQESRVPYDPGPAPAGIFDRAHPSMPKRDPVSDLVRIDPAEVERQLAAFGFTRETIPPLKPRTPGEGTEATTSRPQPRSGEGTEGQND